MGSCAFETNIFRLPFVSDNGAALGIATKTYLDAVRDDKELVSGTKEQIMNQEGKYLYFNQIKDGTLHKSLDTAFTLFDAVSVRHTDWADL